MRVKKGSKREEHMCGHFRSLTQMTTLTCKFTLFIIYSKLTKSSNAWFDNLLTVCILIKYKSKQNQIYFDIWIRIYLKSPLNDVSNLIPRLLKGPTQNPNRERAHARHTCHAPSPNVFQWEVAILLGWFQIYSVLKHFYPHDHLIVQMLANFLDWKTAQTILIHIWNKGFENECSRNFCTYWTLLPSKLGGWNYKLRWGCSVPYRLH